MAEPLMIRRYSMKPLAWGMAGSVLLSIALLLAGVWSGRLWVGLLALLPLLYSAGSTCLRRFGAAFRLYPDRLEVERGVFTRRIENTELFRIRDLGVRQGFLGRMTDFGDVYLHSTDASTPDLVLPAIDSPREFYERIRDLVTESRAQRQTMIVEEGGAAPPGEP